MNDDPDKFKNVWNLVSMQHNSHIKLMKNPVYIQQSDETEYRLKSSWFTRQSPVLI